MTAAYRLKGLGWFASCTAFVLVFYLVSLQVASERNRLEALNGRIRVAERDIRALETEFDTRANLQQLEKWNGDILALSAPVAGQFVTNQAQLASLRFDAPLMGDAAVKTAALVVPTIPAMPEVTAPRQAVLQTASAVIDQPVSLARASATSGAAAVANVASAMRSAAARPQRVAMLDNALLSDLSSGALAEASRR